MTPRESLTVGFDLDDTLFDTRFSIHASLVAVRDQTGVPINADEIIARRGQPIQKELAEYFLGSKLDEALRIFRQHMETFGVYTAEMLPGAARAVRTVRHLGYRAIVLTAKHTPIAVATLEHANFEVDDVVGDLWPEEKAEALRDACAWGYIGDHIKDMQAAETAGVRGIGVTTGACSAEELWQAGADNVLNTLEEFPDIFIRSIQGHGGPPFFDNR